MITFTVYRGESGRFYWRAAGGNGRVIADSSEGYSTLSNVRRALLNFITDISDGRYEWPPTAVDE